jgi:hypothetical protein
MFDLQPPRHISTLRILVVAARSGEGLLTIPLQTSIIELSVCRIRDLRPGEPFDGELDGGQDN